jgi:hypothetical protein
MSVLSTEVGLSDVCCGNFLTLFLTCPTVAVNGTEKPDYYMWIVVIYSDVSHACLLIIFCVRAFQKIHFTNVRVMAPAPQVIPAVL